jgi:hypothetical protein
MQHPKLEYVVAFLTVSDGGVVGERSYLTDVTWGSPHYANAATFSFDPDGPDVEPGANTVTITNRATSIPAGTYEVEFAVIDRTQRSQPTAFFVSTHFTHQYPSTSSADTYNGSSIPTAV